MSITCIYWYLLYLYLSNQKVTVPSACPTATTCSPSNVAAVAGKNRQRSASAAAEGMSADAAEAVAASNDRRPSGASGAGSNDNLADMFGGAQREWTEHCTDQLEFLFQRGIPVFCCSETKLSLGGELCDLSIHIFFADKWIIC